MKKISKKAVMLYAHSIRRACGCSLSEALKHAWARCKREMMYVVRKTEARVNAVREAIHSLLGRERNEHEEHKLDILFQVLGAFSEAKDAIAVNGKACGIAKQACKVAGAWE